MSDNSLSFRRPPHRPGNLTDTRAMLAVLGVPSIETLISQTVPQSIRLDRPLACRPRRPRPRRWPSCRRR